MSYLPNAEEWIDAVGREGIRKFETCGVLITPALRNMPGRPTQPMVDAIHSQMLSIYKDQLDTQRLLAETHLLQQYSQL